MRRFSVFILVAFAAFQFGTISQGQSLEEGYNGALGASHQIFQSMTGADLQKLAQATLNTLVREGNKALARSGHGDEAKQIQQSWNEQFSSYFTTPGFGFEIGDHQPLNAWLADFYKKLQLRVGEPVLKALHLDDINEMNYAVPVVFQPKGDHRNGDHWDGIEYGRHFASFASVVTYWGTYVGCMFASKGLPVMKRYCGIAAMALRQLMKSTLAPRMSKIVYTRITGRSVGNFVEDVSFYDRQASDTLNRIPQN